MRSDDEFIFHFFVVCGVLEPFFLHSGDVEHVRLWENGFEIGVWCAVNIIITYRNEERRGEEGEERGGRKKQYKKKKIKERREQEDKDTFVLLYAKGTDSIYEFAGHAKRGRGDVVQLDVLVEREQLNQRVHRPSVLQIPQQCD